MRQIIHDQRSRRNRRPSPSNPKRHILQSRKVRRQGRQVQRGRLRSRRERERRNGHDLIGRRGIVARDRDRAGLGAVDEVIVQVGDAAEVEGLQVEGFGGSGGFDRAEGDEGEGAELELVGLEGGGDGVGVGLGFEA